MLAGEIDKSVSNLNPPLEIATLCTNSLCKSPFCASTSKKCSTLFPVSPLFFCIVSPNPLADIRLSWTRWVILLKLENKLKRPVNARSAGRDGSVQCLLMGSNDHRGSVGLWRQSRRSTVALSGGVLEISLVQDPGPICQRDAPTERKCWVQAGEPSAPM